VVSSTPSVVVWPPVASTLPSGSTVSVSYERRYFIGAADCHVGLATFMSIVAVALPAWRPVNSGSDQVPALRILPGRYCTALMPSIGLMPTLVHWPVLTFRVRVMRSGPGLNRRPSGSTNMNGYSGIVRSALGSDVHVSVLGL